MNQVQVTRKLAIERPSVSDIVRVELISLVSQGGDTSLKFTPEFVGARTSTAIEGEQSASGSSLGIDDLLGDSDVRDGEIKIDEATPGLKAGYRPCSHTCEDKTSCAHRKLHLLLVLLLAVSQNANFAMLYS